MPDQSASWLDDRLSADASWTELSDRSGEVTVDDGALAAVPVVGTDAAAPDVGVVSDEATWLATTTLAGAADLGGEDDIVLVAADLASAGPVELDDGLGAAFDAGVVGHRDADPGGDDPADPDADVGSGIIDPFDVMLAENAGSPAAAAPDEQASAVEPLDEDLVAAVAEPPGPVTPDAVIESSEAHAEEHPTDPPDDGGSSDLASPAPDSIAITPPSRLDAFDVLDASPTADAGHESDAPPHEDRQTDLPHEPFGTDYE